MEEAVKEYKKAVEKACEKYSDMTVKNYYNYDTSVKAAVSAAVSDMETKDIWEYIENDDMIDLMKRAGIKKE